MGADAAGVLACAALFDAEAFEAEQLFAEEREFLCGNLGHEKLWRVTRIARILVPVLDGLHSLDIVLLGDAHSGTEVEGVDSALVVHHHHDVVRRFVVDQKFSVAVEYEPA